MDGSEFDGTGDEVLNVGAPPPRRPARITVSVAAVLAVIVAGVLIWAHSGSSVSGKHVADGTSGSATPPPPSGSVPSGSTAPVIPPPSGVPSDLMTPAAPMPSDSGPPAPTYWPDGGNIAATKALLAQMVADAPQLPGSTRRSKAPGWAPDPSDDLAMDDKAQLVNHRVWWLAPGTASAAQAYFENHVDSSLTAAGWGTESSGNGPTIHDIEFNAPDTAYATGVELQIVIGPLDGAVGIGIRADAIWTPQRTASETITAPTSVELTVTRYQKAPVDRTLDATEAARLAGIVNGAPTAPEYGGMTSCPIDTDPGGTDFDTITFTTATGQTTVDVGFGCIPINAVTVNGAAEPNLRTYPVDLDAVVLKTLGLPKNY